MTIYPTARRQHSIMIIRLVAAALLGVFGAAQVAGQTTLRDAAAVAVVPASGEAAAFADSLAGSLIIELGLAGFRPAELYRGTVDGALSDPDIARSVSRESRSRWVAVVRCSIDRKRLVWRATIFDAVDGAMIAADAQGAFAGLTAMPLLGESAAKVASEAHALKARVAPGLPIAYRLRFVASDEGALVSFGTGDDSRQAGVIKDGSLTAPFVAFRSGDPVVVSMSKDGYWPRTAVFRPSESDEPIELPALMPRTRQALSAGITSSRLVGASVDYRYYLLPDSLFLRAGDSLWMQSTYTAGSVPVFHDELRLGAGAYLFTQKYSRFRFAAGTGLSGIVTWILPADVAPNLYFDLSLDALWLSLEWHTPTWAIFLEERMSYSFGIDSGLLRRGWWETATGPMTMTLGVMRKWP
jgi:hypothetical protein